MMSIELIEGHDGKILTVRVSGKLTADDYHEFVPEAERLIASHGKIRVLFDMRDFHGWSLAALWEDVKFDLKHFRHIERLALVGDRTWEKWMATFCRPFTSADVRYFDQSEAAQAKQWIEEDLIVAMP